MIRVDAWWLAVQPLDMRVGTEAALAYPSGKVILTACTMPSSPLRWPATNDAVAVLRYGWPDGLASAQARP